MMGRLLRGLGALLVMLAGLTAIPYALWALRGNPLPQRVSLSAVVEALTSRDDGQLLIGLITWIGWIAWLIFALALVAETMSQLSGRQLPIPGLGAPRLLVAPLVAAVLAVAVLIPLANPHTAPDTSTTDRAQISQTHTTPRPAAPDAAQSSDPAGRIDAGGGGHEAGVGEKTAEIRNSPLRAGPEKSEKAATRNVRHTVRSGETLWGLAQDYYGAGQKWRTIAEANTNLVGADGWLDRGWVVTVPDVPVATSAASSPRRGGDRQAEPGQSYRVEKGESLSEISREAYGTAGRWDEVWKANKAGIVDPDLIEIGQKLTIPGDADAAPVKKKSETSKKAKDTKTSKDTEPSKKAKEAAPNVGEPDAKTPSSNDDTNTSDAGKEAAGKGSGQADRQANTDATGARRDASGGVAGAQPDAGVQSIPTSAPQVNPAPAQPPVAANASAGSSDGVEVWEVSIAGAAGLMAAGLLGLFVARRRRRAFSVRPGQRLPAMSAPTRDAVEALRQVEQPLTVEHLDRALRSLAASIAEVDGELPLITAVRLADDRIDLRLLDPDTQAPAPFTSDADGSVWTILSSRADELLDVAACESVPAPYPALVTLGRDSDGAHLLVDVETLGALQVEDAEVLAAIAFELATSSWADDVAVTLVGVCPDLPAALGVDRLRYADDLDAVLTQLEHEAVETTAVLDADGIDDPHHGRVTAAAELTPHLLLIGQPMQPAQVAQLEKLLLQQPRIAVAAITPDDTVGEWSLREGRLNPAGLEVEPQRLNADTVAALCAAARESQQDITEPAPWWDHDATDPAQADVATLPLPAVDADELDADELDDVAEPGDDIDVTGGQDDEVTGGQDDEAEEVTDSGLLGDIVVELGDGGDGQPEDTPLVVDAGAVSVSAVAAASETEGAVMAKLVDRTITSINPLLEIPHPVLLLLGEVSINTDGQGQLSSRRGVSELLEPITFLHLNPARPTTAFKRAMAHRTNDVDALASRARRFLGHDEDGVRYFPTATRTEHGRAYQLHDGVTSDWAYLNTLISAGVNVTSTQHLVQALRLVRGRPLDSVPGGGWPWADDFVETATSIIITIAHEITDRALNSGDYTTARWALQQGREVDRLTEVLARDELRLERLAGSPTAAQRVADRIYAAARNYQVSLDPETLSLLNEMGDQRRYRGA